MTSEIREGSTLKTQIKPSSDSLNSRPYSRVEGGRRLSCTVCCIHYGHDCDLVEVETDAGARFLMCWPIGCMDCHFTVPVFVNGKPIKVRTVRKLAQRHIAQLGQEAA